jgi:steroid 5-alpha reductase family enzyme
MNVAGFTHLWLPMSVMLVLAVAGWVLSLKLRDVSIVDSLWSVFFIVFVLLFAWRMRSDTPASFVLIALILLWGLRLSAYITLRNHGKGEDRRYQAIRARNQPNFEFKSFYLVFILQMVLASIIVQPVVPILNEAQSAGLLTYAGFAVAAFGALFETVADAQMARYKATRTAQDQVMNRGLWRYSRHPNYFGEAVFWWGIWIASASMGGAWTLFSPLLMTWLLTRVSGVPLLEADLQQRSAAYRHYLMSTPRFIPGRPRTPPATT